MFINGILTNCEVWYGLQTSEIEELEEVDEILLRKILGAHSKTAKEMLYLETGTTPLRFSIQKRRMSYLHHILTRNENELIKRVFNAQERKPIKDDWINTINSDKESLGVKYDNNDIKNMKINKFKKYVKTLVKEKTLKYLNSLKSQHSKVKHIKFEQLNPQKYFFHKDFTFNDIQLLFKLRTRMINVKKNFSSIYENLTCEFCEDNEIETQKHLLYCKKFLSMSSDQDLKNDVQYEDIFSDPEKQLKITRCMQSILKVREKLQDKSHENFS